MSITFDELRAGTLRRLLREENDEGHPVFTRDGSNWTASDYLMRLTASLGCLAGTLSFIREGNITEQDGVVSSLIEDELVEILESLDLLAYRVGVNLGEAFARTKRYW